jgi:tyrosine-protein kinase Etk/Wzc
MQDSSSSIVPATLGVDDLVLSQLLKQLQQTESEYQKLRKTTGENNPALSSLTNEISRTRRNILENIQNQRENLEASRTNLALTKSKYVAALQRIPIQERELLEISRQQATKKNVYSLLLEKREETALSYTPANLNTRVVELAEASIYPVSPRPLLAYFAALVLSFVCGVTFVIGKGLLSRKVTSRTQIADATDAPIVAEISRIKGQQVQTFTALADPRLVEQFRQLRVSLGLYGKTINKQKVLVTSSIPGEGKSFVSANLAYTLAKSGKKVALLDLDLRKPSVSQLFEKFGEKGITDYLTGDVALSDIIKRTQYDHLCVVPAGTLTGDYTDFLLDGALDSIFSKLSSMFDYIIIDSPPLDLVTDGYLLSDYCDISLLVIRRNFTPKAVMEEFSHSNKETALHKLVIVFNAVRHSNMSNGAYGKGIDNGKTIKPVYKRNFMKSSA